MTSLSKNARIAGLLYIVGSIFGVVRLIYIPEKLFVHGNGAATASNILAHESLFRFGIVSQLVCAALWILVTLALYRLFKGVDQELAVLMVILGSLMVTPIFFMNSVNDAAALLFARGGEFLTAFDHPQREASAVLFMRFNHAQRRFSRDHARQLESGSFKQRGKFFFGALASAGKNQHLQVEPFGEVRRIVGADH